MSTTYRLVESKLKISVVFIFETKINMQKTHSTQGMHEHNLHAGWIQIKYQHGMYFWNKNNIFKTHGTHDHNLHAGWIQVKHQHCIYNKYNMFKTHSTGYAWAQLTS